MISLKLEDRKLVVFFERAQLQALSGSMSTTIGQGVRDAAELVRTRAVRNVSGYPVSWQGGAFVVNVRTGALKGAIESQWPYGGPLQARVFVNSAHTSVTSKGGYPSKPVPVGRYAAAIEYGHHAIDLKKTMEGKIVPFFGARASGAHGPYTETGLHSIGGGRFVSKVPKSSSRKPMSYRRQQTATGSAYYIAFRRVGKTGWVVPEAKPRPFMRAALSSSRDDIRRLISGRLREALIAPTP